MRIKQNPLIKGLVAVMIFVPIYFLASNNGKDEAMRLPDNASTIGDEKPLVTQSEEVAALSGYITEFEGQLAPLAEKIDSIVTKEEVANMIQNIRGDSTSEINEEKLLSSVNKLVEAKLKAIQDKLIKSDAIASNRVGNINNEIPFADAFEVNVGATAGNTQAGHDEEIEWIYPVGFVVEEDGALSNIIFGNASANSSSNPLGDAFDSVGNSVKKGSSSAAQFIEKELKPIPLFTIPPDSSLHGATAINALIGRIERKGVNHDPFKFQLMLSGETLIANGHNASQIRNAMVSGIAVGDWANSCVRGRITSFTFVFDDGRIFNKQGTSDDPLALLGDKWGNPCVKGILIDDIDSFLTVQSGLSGLASVAEQISKQQQTINSSGNSQSLSLSGSAGKLAAGSFVSGGLNKTQEILADRYESYYEAIYVKPGEVVSLLVEQMIDVDYIPTNRKVTYEKQYTNFTLLD